MKPNQPLAQIEPLSQRIPRERWFATTYDDRSEKKLALIDQPSPEGMGSKLKTINEDILFDCLFQLSY